MTPKDDATLQQPATMADYDPREDSAWIYSFGAAMVPFCGFLYIHKLGMTARVVEATVRSPIGVYGLFLLPFCTLAMEKSIYDTVQSWQGIDPQIRPADRGGFPSGGAGKLVLYRSGSFMDQGPCRNNIGSHFTYGFHHYLHYVIS